MAYCIEDSSRFTSFQRRNRIKTDLGVGSCHGVLIRYVQYNNSYTVGENGMYTNRVQNTNKKIVLQKTTFKSSDPGIQKIFV